MNKHQMFLKVARFVEQTLHGVSVRLNEEDKRLFGLHKLLYPNLSCDSHEYISGYNSKNGSKSCFTCNLYNKTTGKKIKYRELVEIICELEHQLIYNIYAE